MKTPKIAIISFPGNNCEVESLRAVQDAGMEAVYFRWNDDTSKLADIDGYFLPGGFSYEDRGRAGMVAARDRVLDFIRDEAAKGKPVIGNCNGAQVLVESGLIPLGRELSMSLAHNAIDGKATGFLSEWVWVVPGVAADRCCTSNWSTPMHMPIAHGEGRFTTRDKDVLEELKKNNQLAFLYCNEEGTVSEEVSVTPNGSVYGVAGICNPEGNVVALMPHPERTPNGAPYFASLKKWIETHAINPQATFAGSIAPSSVTVPQRSPQATEIFIDMTIVNNEERTVEQAAKRILHGLQLKQMKYISTDRDPALVLSRIALFNPNKEKAYIRKGGTFYEWDSDAKKLTEADSVLSGSTALLRRNDPDTGASSIGGTAETGVCYVCSGVSKDDVCKSNVLEIFGNPHSSTIEILES